MKCISLYTGAGGLDLGLEEAGFETAVAVEKDSGAAATLAENKTWPVIEADVRSDEASTARILKRGKLEVGEATMLVGGPPCQPFSKSAFWRTGETKRLHDPRASTLEEFLRVMAEALPLVVLLENVPGLGYRNKDEGLSLLRQVISAINQQRNTNYNPSVAILNAADYGVPQERKRLFLVAHRDGLDFRFPEPTHIPAPKVGTGEQFSLEGKPYYHTSWDAIGHLEHTDDPSLSVTGKWADLLPSIPEGQNYLYHTDRGGGLPLFGWRTRFWSFLLKLSKQLPSWTITAQPGSATGPFHWNNRRLSTEELLRIQTFPNGYEVVRGRTSQQMQLGNAVPSALAEKLGLEIRTQFLGDSEARHQPLNLLPKRRRPVPPPVPVCPVPEQYMSLAGDHAPHPGTGKGPGATANR